MCLIVDVNVVHKIFPPENDFVDIYNALTTKRTARMVYGGELRREYAKMEDFRRRLVRLDQQGSARSVDDVSVDAETERLKQGNACRSNDHHVIALARVSGARLLCSDDQALCQDFKDSTLVAKPRGSVYRRRAHAPLIKRHCRRWAAHT